ncbi:MAG: hypothetical protein IJI45_01460 [Anaerolineaceae bacterium]|nr:hypothetical protein [Anaerolineaceae bacterium]
MFRNHELLCNADAYFKLKEIYGEDFIDRITNNEVGTICAMLSMFSTKAEAYHRFMHEPAKDPLDAAELLITMNVRELAEAKVELLEAINNGLDIKTDPNQEIDLVLQENQKKTD